MEDNALFNEQRGYGIEIEGVGVSPYNLSEAMDGAGIDVGSSAYCDVWKVKEDGSLQYSSYSQTFEVVSPILIGLGEMEILREVCSIINGQGGKVNKSCGLHVHHHAEDMSGHDLLSLVSLYRRCEEVIDSFVSPSRGMNNNQYCHALRRMISVSSLNGVDVHQRILSRNMVLNLLSGERYMTLNLQSLHKYGTVEFRHHQGTTDFNKMYHWVVFTQAMVETAKRAFIKPNEKALTFEQMVEVLHLKDDTIEYLVGRRAHFGYNPMENVVIPEKFYLDYVSDNNDCSRNALSIGETDPSTNNPPTYVYNGMMRADNRRIWEITLDEGRVGVANIRNFPSGARTTAFNIGLGKSGRDVRVAIGQPIPPALRSNLTTVFAPPVEAG